MSMAFRNSSCVISGLKGVGVKDVLSGVHYSIDAEKFGDEFGLPE
jgi:hypothetical protein